VGVEVIHDQNHSLGLRIPVVKKILDEPGKVLASPLLRDLDLTPTCQGLKGSKQGGDAVAAILAVIALDGSGFGGDRQPDFFVQLLGALVHADYRPGRVIRTPIDLQDIFHPAHKLGIVLGRDAPALLQVGLDLVFFSTLRTVS
jgi:hypothetical protein